jgi:hypothetical protein
MGLGQYFRVVKRIVFVEIRAAKAFASCCGVNLAEGAFFGWAATSPTRLQPTELQLTASLLTGSFADRILRRRFFRRPVLR